MASRAQTILVVDDHEDSRLIMRLWLGYQGRRVLEAADGHECLSIARRERPDVIVLDLVLPRMNGWEAAQALRRDPATAAIPIVALTAALLPEDQERALRAGCEIVVAKPAPPGLLLYYIDLVHNRVVHDAMERGIIGRAPRRGGFATGIPT